MLKQIENARGIVREFISAESDSEIFFNSGSTLAQAQVVVLAYLKDGDEILYSPLDHRSFVDPWFDLQRKLKHFGININLVPYQNPKLAEQILMILKIKLILKQN